MRKGPPVYVYGDHLFAMWTEKKRIPFSTKYHIRMILIHHHQPQQQQKQRPRLPTNTISSIPADSVGQSIFFMCQIQIERMARDCGTAEPQQPVTGINMSCRQKPTHGRYLFGSSDIKGNTATNIHLFSSSTKEALICVCGPAGCSCDTDTVRRPGPSSVDRSICDH